MPLTCKPSKHDNFIIWLSEYCVCPHSRHNALWFLRLRIWRSSRSAQYIKEEVTWHKNYNLAIESSGGLLLEFFCTEYEIFLLQFRQVIFWLDFGKSKSIPYPSLTWNRKTPLWQIGQIYVTMCAHHLLWNSNNYLFILYHKTSDLSIECLKHSVFSRFSNIYHLYFCDVISADNKGFTIHCKSVRSIVKFYFDFAVISSYSFHELPHWGGFRI